jgi:hypothetical protein
LLLTITTTHRPATDLGYLLHKHPGRFQSCVLSFGRAHVFYPEATAEHCRACLLLDVDDRAGAEPVAGRHGYTVRILAVGPVDEKLGPPTQMAVFSCEGNAHG